MLKRDTKSDGCRVKATIFGVQFTGRIAGIGHDSMRVVYVRDGTDRERAVRPDRRHHHLELLDEPASRGTGGTNLR